MKAIGYQRASTDDQTHGLDAQRDAIEALVKREAAWTLDTVFADEGVSGATGLDKRPGLLEAVARLEKGDVLVVAKRDRLGRDPIVVAMIEAAVARKGARIVSTVGEGTESDDPTAVLMRRIVDAFSEYERLIIKARTKAALQAKKRRGERTGQIPFGFHLAIDGVHLERDEEEQKVIELIQSLRKDGESIRKIAERLNNDKVSARGKRWYPTSVVRVLKAA